ncbi:MAG: hypothetical protein INR71_02935 [Terriglobus roseus]|nr:hypothetical protein [Terriglobus roseus]
MNMGNNPVSIGTDSARGLRGGENIIPFPIRSKSPVTAEDWGIAAIADHVDLADLAASLSKTSRLVVRCIRAGDPSLAAEHLISLRARTEQVLAGLATTMTERRVQPHLDLYMSQLDAAQQAEEHARAEALIASIYELCDADKTSNNRDGGTP